LDLVSTTVYESSTRKMSFFIGNALSIDEITEASFREAAAEIHIGERFAARRYNFICNHFREALREAADELQEAGFSKAEEIEERILHTGGYAKLKG
jgi:serine/threonine-protein kinase HipA